MKNITYIVLLAVPCCCSSRAARPSSSTRPSRRSSCSSASRSATSSPSPACTGALPFIQDVRRFDKRLLDWDGDVSQIPTLGREFIIVDTTARWRISDPLQFLRSVRDESGARTRLDDVLDSAVRDIVSGTELEEIVRSADWQVDVSRLAAEDAAALEAADLERPKKGRGQLERGHPRDGIAANAEHRHRARRRADQADQLHRLRRPAGRKPHDLGAPEHRGALPLRRRRPQPGDPRQHAARAAANRVRGRAPSRRRSAAAPTPRRREIYGEAYGQDPAFYAFSKTLESYSTLGENTTLMIDAKSDFFRYLESTSGR